MARFSNKELIDGVQNGKDDILFYLSKKFFHPSRRWLLRNGCRDNDTPSVFSKVVVKVYREIQQNKLSANIDFENYFNSSLKEFYKSFKEDNAHLMEFDETKENEIVSSCFSILDDSSRRLLISRYVDKLTYEQIASRFEFSNPVIAEFECNKAFNQFDKITRVRLNVAAQL